MSRWRTGCTLDNEQIPLPVLPQCQDRRLTKEIPAWEIVSASDSGPEANGRDLTSTIPEGAKTSYPPPPVAANTRILISTPGGKLSPLLRASMVLPVGWRISTSRLWV